MEDCHLSCSFYGCKRTYNNSQSLSNHLKDHHKNPAQSLPGKAFLCSTIGCDGSFSNMQQLMDHMRHHHKPNYFFLCESCRAKLRSYRTLLKHLQTCAKVAKSKAAKVELGTAPDGDPLAAVDMEPSGPFLAADEPQLMDSEPSMPTNPAMVPQSGLQPPGIAVVPDRASVGTPATSVGALEPKTQGLPAQLDASYSSFPPSLSPAPPACGPDPSQQDQQWVPRVSPSSLPSSPPNTPPGSNAVWRKNQGQSFSSRILWEHTRGRYSCLQCGHCTPDRKEMTAHIEGQHRSPGGKVNSDTDAVMTHFPLPRTTPDTENSNYTQL